MCGIYGVFVREGLRGDLSGFKRASNLSIHRGPDGAGIQWFDTNTPPPSMAQAAEEWNGNRPPTLVLGHRRLAIIDLSAHGHQPMSAAEGSLWITYNGELYNFVELRSELAQLGVSFQTGSDTEVVLKAYEMWGPEAVKRFVGMWAFALLDLRMRHLMLSRDRFGIKPLHYHVSPNGFAFASEIKQLLVTPGVPNRINERCVYDYLQFEAVDAGPETFFTGINKLEPGNNLFVSLDTGEVGKTCYYTPPEFGTLQQISTADAAEQFRALLKDSVRIHLRADVPVGTCLSGGLDSSSIAMLMREVAREAGLELDRHSFSSHFDAPEADELEYTRMSIAASEVVPHFVAPTAESLLADLRKLVWHQDEPFGSTSIYAQWTVFRLIQQHGIKVVLDGQGSDEMLGGYASTMPHFLLELAGRGPAWKALWESWRWARLQGTSWTSQIPYPTLRRALTRVLRQASVASLADPPWLNSEFADRYSGSSQYLANMGQHPFGPGAHFSNILYQFFFLNNLPSLLRYEDRNSMAFSVEARVPFLDHRLVEFVFSLPARLKIRNGYTKRVLRDSMAGTLPERIRMRARKMGFATPERQWQIGPLRQLIREAIASSRLASFIRPEVASRHFEAVLDSNRLSFAPWRWLNLWLWAEEFRVG